MDDERAQARIKELEAQVLLLTQQLDWLKRQLFDRKSERFEHPELFDPAEPGKAPSSGHAAAPEDKPQAASRRTSTSQARAQDPHPAPAAAPPGH
ncbi:putative membrane protein [Haloferula luteola]|uniref:Putative membrane protein n=1 Tax=Haloferula luteola TaxID=595692 RepID=A0A840V5X7_9BACT|nr:hypothetical protein [Haloferula luteola]MBB5353425.1 putative membrane protein [Haloferula luteola]